MCKSIVCTTMYVVALQCVRIPALMNAKNPLSQRGSKLQQLLPCRPPCDNIQAYRAVGRIENLLRHGYLIQALLKKIVLFIFLSKLGRGLSPLPPSSDGPVICKGVDDFVIHGRG